jgi:hypothetical protein
MVSYGRSERAKQKKILGMNGIDKYIHLIRSLEESSLPRDSRRQCVKVGQINAA